MISKNRSLIVGGVGTGTAAMLALILIIVNRPQAVAQSSDIDNASASDDQAVRVEVAKPKQRSFEQFLEIPASLEPGEMAELYAKASGYVSKLNVDIGHRVKKNEPLLTIDIPEMRDELEQAEAVLAATNAKVHALHAKADQAQSMIVTARAQIQRNEAELSLERITAKRKRRLFEENAIPEQDLDEATSRLAVMEAEVQIAQANVQAAKAEMAAVEADVTVAEAQVAVQEARLARLRTLMSYSIVRAPFDGIITERFVDPGAFVRSAAEGATMPVLTIARVDYVRLVMHVPQSDVPHINVGTKIEARCAQVGSESIKVRVTRMAKALREDTRTMRVEADIDNANGQLIPGLYARTLVLLKSESQALMIPSKAVRVRGRDVSVLVADGSVARAKPINVGYDDGIWAQVKEGLSGDERIIISAAGAIAPGAPITAVQAGL